MKMEQNFYFMFEKAIIETTFLTNKKWNKLM